MLHYQGVGGGEGSRGRGGVEGEVTLATDEVRSSVIQHTCGKYITTFGWSYIDASGWREFVSGGHNLCPKT
jgi:hypothetical protein